jgi:hypothetical protein
MTSTDAKSSESKGLKKENSLPFNAALAPPFQPRGEPCHSANSSVTDDSSGFTGSRDQTESRTTESADQASSGLGSKRTPYLVGYISVPIKNEQNDNEEKQLEIYGRQLTQEEKLARHLYWGKAPRHLHQNLPRFDGKDFYPPSPVKGSSGSGSVSSARLPSDDVIPTHRVPRKITTDPFRSLSRVTGSSHSTARKTTVSEAIPRDEYKAPRLRSPMSSRVAKAEGSSEDSVEAVSDVGPSSASQVSKDKPMPDDDEEEVVFKGRGAQRKE